MGRTIATYRIRLEKEQKKRWKGFRDGFRFNHQEPWDRLWDHAHRFSDASTNALGSVIYDSIFVSMLLGLQTEINELKKSLKSLKRELKEAKK